MLKAFPTLCLLIGLLANSTAQGDGEGQAHLQGKWHGSSEHPRAEENGVVDMNLTIGGNRFQMTSTFGELTALTAQDVGVIRLTTSATPKAIDLLIPSDVDPALYRLGIYRIEGQYLKVCLAEHGKNRPTAFTTTDTQTCFKLMRVKGGQ
jgi:uncharacterized protein (TIGR03067 family)